MRKCSVAAIWATAGKYGRSPFRRTTTITACRSKCRRRAWWHLNLPLTTDGYIARADGSFDWLDRPRPRGNYGMAAFFASVDTILWGRKTYDQALTMGGVGGFGTKMKNYVFTHRP